MNSIMFVGASIFWGTLVLSLLVGIHEAGHFIFARLQGMRVSEFFFGMPCKYKLSYRLRRWGTEVGITPVLIGGYNRICGMNPHLPQAMSSVFAYVQKKGSVSIEDVVRACDISHEEARASLEMLCDWCSIKEVDGTFLTQRRDPQGRCVFDTNHDFSLQGTHPEGAPNPLDDPQASFEQEKACTYTGKKFLQRMLTLAAGPLFNIMLAFVLFVVCLSFIGFTTALNSNTIGKVVSGSYAEKVGLTSGDTIVSVDNRLTTTWEDTVQILSGARASNKPFIVEYLHQGTRQRTTLDFTDKDAHESFGIVAQTKQMYLSIPEALGFGVRATFATLSFIGKLFIPTQTLEAVSQTSSVVGISAVAARAAEQGIQPLLMICGMISLSLGCMNLLPIPPLDGGKALMEIIEFITKKPVSMRCQMIVSYVGIGLFVVLFVVALRQDIIRIIAQ